jgi:hypothetical protein
MVEDARGCRHPSGRRIEIGLPHVPAQEADVRAELGSELFEEGLEALLGTVAPDPQQALAVLSSGNPARPLRQKETQPVRS